MAGGGPRVLWILIRPSVVLHSLTYRAMFKVLGIFAVIGFRMLCFDKFPGTLQTFQLLIHACCIQSSYLPELRSVSLTMSLLYRQKYKPGQMVIEFCSGCYWKIYCDFNVYYSKGMFTFSLVKLKKTMPRFM